MFQCRIDAEAFAACTTPFTSAALADGAHTFEVRATDPAGNTDPTPAPGPHGRHHRARDHITGGPAAATDQRHRADIHLHLDRGRPRRSSAASTPAPFAACTRPHHRHAGRRRAHLRGPRHRLRRQRRPDPGQRRRSRSTPPPPRHDRSPPARPSPTNDDDPDIRLHLDRGRLDFECRIDGAAFAACTSPFTTAALADGPHTFEVRAIDPPGNIDPTPASRTFTVDTDGARTRRSPAARRARPTTRRRRSRSPRPRRARRFECRIDGERVRALHLARSPRPRSPTGTHTFEVRATDPAGNTDPTPAEPHLHGRHRRAPETDDRPPARPGPTNDTHADVHLHLDRGRLDFECRVDAAAFAACTSPLTTRALTDGAHTFEVRAIDTAGNADPTPATRTFTVDTDAADDHDRLAVPPSPTNDTTPTFTFSSARPARPSSAASTAAAFAACTTPFTTAALADGAHTFEVRATDPAGNTDADAGEPHLHGRHRRAARPRSRRAARGARPTTRRPTFTFTSTEAGSTLPVPRRRARVRRLHHRPCTTATLADGTHTFEVRATDAAGNTDPTPATATFTVSTTPAATCDGKAATIVGTPGDDSLVGTSGVDVIVGLGGDDTITGGGGNDTICGNAGNDRIQGGGGNDTVDGGDGNDIIIGAAGDDSLTGGSDDDTLTGSGGDDTLAGNDGDDTLAGNGGDDHLDGGPGHDSGNGGAGTNVVIDCETLPWPSHRGSTRRSGCDSRATARSMASHRCGVPDPSHPRRAQPDPDIRVPLLRRCYATPTNGGRRPRMISRSSVTSQA